MRRRKNRERRTRRTKTRRMSAEDRNGNIEKRAQCPRKMNATSRHRERIPKLQNDVWRTFTL